MRVSVLGSVAVSDDTRSISGRALGGRRARIALVALALSHADVSGFALAESIWADELPATWQTALRGLVLGLRRAVGDLDGGQRPLIETAPGGYRLVAGVEVDLELAAAAVHRAADQLAADQPQAVLDALGPIAGLSGRDLLPDVDAAWLEPHRQRVERLALHASELVVEAALRLGQFRRAVDVARGAVATWPFDEPAHRILIEALGRSGDRAGAVLAYDQCRTVLSDQLGLDPSAETVAVYLDALRGPATRVSARVPVQLSSFVGRETEVAALTEVLTTSRPVTVTGRGGVGKTRLAMQVAGSGGDFPGGRFWVSLAAVADDALVTATVALGLGVTVGADDPGLSVARFFAPLGRALLVLDGCEAVPDGVASLLTTLLADAPLLTVLSTSRSPLSVDGEVIVRVAPLPPPGGADGLLQNGQVRLLIDRVREAGGELHTDPALVPHLVALCRRCEGLPLALELAAGQLAAMPPGDLLDHLGELGPGVDQGLRSVALASYQLLDADEQSVFRALAVLDGTVGLPLLREVVSSDQIPGVRVVRILRELTARGLVTVDRSGARWRYSQDDDLHRFAAELLAASGQEPVTYARLADAIRGCLPEDARSAPAAFQDEVTDLLGSVRSLFGAAVVGRADLDRCQELGFRLHRYFAATNVGEGRFWLKKLLRRQPAGPWTPYATYALGYLSFWSGDTGDAMRYLGVAAQLLVDAHDPYRARALIFLAGLVDDIDRAEEALSFVRASIEAAAPFGADLRVSAAMGLGTVLAERGDPAAAGYARDAIELCRAEASAEQLSIALPTAAMVSWQVGALTQARDYVAEAMPLHVGSRRISRVVLLSAAAAVALADGDVPAALDYGERAETEAHELGVIREVPLVRVLLTRALLADGDRVAAAARCVDALESALSASVAFPAATALETAALVLHTCRAAPAGVIGELMAAAARIRLRGDRRGPAPLAWDHSGGPSAPVREAAELAAVASSLLRRIA